MFRVVMHDMEFDDGYFFEGPFKSYGEAKQFAEDEVGCDYVITCDTAMNISIREADYKNDSVCKVGYITLDAAIKGAIEHGFKVAFEDQANRKVYILEAIPA